MSKLCEYEEIETEPEGQEEKVQDEFVHPSILPLYGAINSQNCYSLYFNMINLIFSPTSDINPKTCPVLTIPITTDGGDVDYALSLVGLIKCLKYKGFSIRTVAIGVVASAGTIIYLTGDEKVCVSTSKLMFHDMSATLEGQLSSIRADTKRLVKLKKELSVLIANSSNLTATEVSNRLLTNTDKYISAKELKTMGMCDLIIR